MKPENEAALLEVAKAARTLLAECISGISKQPETAAEKRMSAALANLDKLNP